MRIASMPFESHDYVSIFELGPFSANANKVIKVMRTKDKGGKKIGWL